jgi:Zn-dependent protease with chaperone function
MERDAYKLANTLLAAKVERLAELEAERLGQQVADEKVKYALAEVARAEKNDFISRQGWQQALKLIQMAVAALEEHNCSHSCDGTLERSLAILKTKF